MREPVDGMVLALDLVAPTVQGAIQGCVYGLLGLGLVLLYKSNNCLLYTSPSPRDRG